jgi:hypothetical protein
MLQGLESLTPVHTHCDELTKDFIERLSLVEMIPRDQIGQQANGAGLTITSAEEKGTQRKLKLSSALLLVLLLTTKYCLSCRRLFL